MLKLTNIVKTYTTGDVTVGALNGVSVAFRDSEFVAVLGPSGCGKTTLLNILGGLDRYDSGDLIINQVSTKQYTDRNWDAYRNHSVGFVFQSYNLIPHQTVLSNVELALTLSGVSKEERRARAKAVLEKVGLGDQLKKKPNQMSGGQMQRVAIARALVNDPEILLADEPTGALDSETSVQIMDLLKEVAEDRLVIMVTHNPELADAYASRIVRLQDGVVIGDTNPYDGQEDESLRPDTHKDAKENLKIKNMSLWTALSLSLNNLWTKKGRTILTSFAGSIGIIGIAMILSMSTGVHNYIDKVQKETLSKYPLSIGAETMNIGQMAMSMQESMNHLINMDKEEGYIYTFPLIEDLLTSMSQGLQENDLHSLKQHIDNPANGFADITQCIQYQYGVDLNVYTNVEGKAPIKVNPGTLTESMGSFGSSSDMSSEMMTSQMQSWSELLPNQEILDSQYDIIQGRWPQAYDEVVIVADDSTLSDYSLIALGLLTENELREMMQGIMTNTEYTYDVRDKYACDELLSLTYKLLLPTDYYEYDEATGLWVDISKDSIKLQQAINNGLTLKVVGIVEASEDAVASSLSGVVGYSHLLTEYVVNQVANSDIAKAQLDNPDTDIFTGLSFVVDDTGVEVTMDMVMALVNSDQFNDEQRAQMQAMFANMTEEQIIEMFKPYFTPKATENTYEGNLKLIQYTTMDDPSQINLYPLDFASKDLIEEKIREYNANAPEGKEIRYTDYVGLLLSSVTTIIDVISYVLIGFVSVSLVVSSIMIGIITYISVLERTKEIGIIRSIGGSKRDISRIFNAEAVSIGFIAGLVGIGTTFLLTIPANIILESLSDIPNLVTLPLLPAGILVAISVFLTFISGLIPSGFAANRDPVIALRTE